MKGSMTISEMKISQDLRHEGQRLLLDLGQRLEERDGDADDEADDHHRAATLRR